MYEPGVVVHTLSDPRIQPAVFLSTSINGVLAGGNGANTHMNSFVLRDDEIAACLDELVPKHMAQAHVPGAVVTVVRAGQVIHGKGYSYANVEAQVPVNAETTVSRIGSISNLTWNLFGWNF